MSSPFTLKVYRWEGATLSLIENTYETFQAAHAAAVGLSLPSSEAIATVKIYNAAGELVHNATTQSNKYPTYA